MNTFYIQQITTTYDRRGAIKSQELSTAKHHETIHAAFADFNGRGRGVCTFPTHNTSVKYEVHGPHGVRVTLEDYYRHVMGEDTFQQQLADEDFSINLDAWLAAFVATDDPAQALQHALRPSARAAINAIEAMF